MIRFAEPLFFLLLLLAPLVLFGSGSGARIRYSHIASFQGLFAKKKWHPRMVLPLLRMLALGAIVCALARPQAGKVFSQVRSEGVDIIIAVDTSDSMKAMDFTRGSERVTRLEILKDVASSFVQKRPNDRLGLVVFGEEAYVQCPLTLDHGIVLDFIKHAEIGVAGGDATAIGSALAVSVARLKDLKAKEKIVILTTDGENNAGRITPMVAADIAKSLGVKVYTIGIGSKGGAPVLVNTIMGPTYQYMNFSIDEELLTNIAQKTGGHYYRATDAKKLEEIYSTIDKLEKTEVKIKQYTEYEELFYYALVLGIFLILLEIGLANTLLRKIP